MTYRSRTAFRVVGALLTGAVLGGTAACTAGGAAGDRSGASARPDATTVAAVQRAATKGAGLNSLSYRVSGKVPGQGAVKGKASFSLRPRVVEMRMTASGGLQEGEFSVRLVRDAVYVGGGEQAAVVLGGKHWLKLAMTDQGAGGFGGMQRQADQDPAAQASLLPGSDDVRKVGEETVDGARTTHYAGVVDVAKAAKAAKKPTGKRSSGAERRTKVIEQYQELGVSELKLDLWVGPGDRTVKFRQRARATQGPLDISIRFLDVNKPVTVQAPPASDTVDPEAKLKGASRRLG
ncbi:hypothetical protein QT196_36090 [Streptomyces sp. P9-2B-2]|uniref:hypothetical protein n=1 Tax=Streptomyces sp. P9-2B-2 TaxID=3057114 RepID=UPI0025B3EBA8|nr:hypothetical protein [Streptomyces sp. P9-2B-2]WJY42238.1 hypothetical protein QT196_36090 [Streptomyces sp. P9-2B-2]